MLLTNLPISPAHPKRSPSPLESRLSEEVLRQRLSEIRCSHEDGDGADDVENAEAHQEEAVDDGGRKLPLLGQAELPVVLLDAIHQELHLGQEGLQLPVCRCPPAGASMGLRGGRSPRCHFQATGSRRGGGGVRIRGRGGKVQWWSDAGLERLEVAVENGGVSCRRFFLQSSASGVRLQLVGGLEGVEDHVGQVSIRLRVAGNGQHGGLSVEAVGLRQRGAQLSQAGLQGAQAGGEVVGG